MSIGLVYLSWAGAGLESVQRFAASLGAHPPGAEHTLIIAWKGYRDPETLARARAAVAAVDHDEITVSADGLDLSAYAEAGSRVAFDTLCLLNSSSAILADGWLGHLSHALAVPGVGIVGASASYESALSSAPRPLRPLLRQRFPAFPNPHLRSNAFMLDREVMLSLHWPPTARKRSALALESGTDGITSQLRARGLEARVVGSDGTAFAAPDWPRSATFRSGEQENLLVADNRTRQYADADAVTRRALRRMAWGDLAG